MSRHTAQILLEALYADAAENNRPRLHVTFDYKQLKLNPADAFKDYVCPQGSLILNLHVAAAKNIYWDETGFSCVLGSKGQAVSMFAPWSAFAQADLPMVVKMPTEQGDLVDQLLVVPMPMGEGVMHLAGVASHAAAKEASAKRPALKVVK